MSIRIQISVSVVIVLALLALFHLIRKGKIQLKYSLMWLVMAAGVLLLVWVPQLLYLLSDLMGVDVPVNAVFFLGFCFALVIIFVLTMLVSSLSLHMKTLTQKMALLEKRVRELEEKEEEEREEDK